jgi:hypothetical protein
MADSTSEDRTVMHLRIPADLHAALKERAARDRRSVNATAVIAFERFLAEPSDTPDPTTHLR